MYVPGGRAMTYSGNEKFIVPCQREVVLLNYFTQTVKNAGTHWMHCTYTY